MAKKNYIFTNRNHSTKGIMSTILGVLSWLVILFAVSFTYQNGGTANLRYGAAALLAFLFCITGTVLGILSRMEQDKYYLFSYIGIGLNAAMLIAEGFILYAGVMGL